MLPKSFMLMISLLLWVHESRASLAKPGCQERCGNITVPYPYGMGTGCFLHKSFEVSCNESSSHVSLLRFANNDKFPISEISMESIRIADKVPFKCNDSTTRSSPEIFQLDRHFRYSHRKNVYIAAGCNIFAKFESVSPWLISAVACISSCITTPVGGFLICNGSNGCCQHSIPVEINKYQAVVSSYGSKYSACSHVFIAEKDHALTTDFYAYSETMYHFPVVLNWVIALISCDQALRRGKCLCGQNSDRIDSSKSLGHNCRCKKGYGGNPYLRTGCQDIDECLSPSNFSCKGNQRCINTPGSYKCTSLHGYKSIISGIIASVIGVLAFGAISYWTYKELGRRKENKIKQEFFRRNGGYLLEQHISANNSHVMKH